MLNGVGCQVQTIIFIFFCAHTLVINKSYSNEKLKGMNELSPITNEYMNPNP